jgi:hypothetical protein
VKPLSSHYDRNARVPDILIGNHKLGKKKKSFKTQGQPWVGRVTAKKHIFKIA